MPPLRLDRRQAAARAAAFLVLLAVAGWPWPAVRRGFATAYCATVGAALPLVGFRGGTARARLMAEPPTDVRRPGDNVTSDAAVELSIDASPRRARLGVNLRRDAYLPLLLLVGAVAVAPLRRRDRAICLLWGVPIVLAASLAALATTVAWVFAGGLGPPEAMKSHALDLIARLLLAPPANRFIAPLVLAALLIFWRLGRRTAAQSAAPSLAELPE